MALTPAEKQRAYRERQKERRKLSLKEAESMPSVFRTAFSEYVADDWFGSDYDIALGLAGLETPSFDDDRGPIDFIRGDLPEGETFPDNASNSLGRAEVITGLLITAAADLALMINDYKKAEIKARLAEIEASDLSDPDTKKAALKDVTRLNKMLDQLDKQVRWTFPQWKVTG